MEAAGSSCANFRSTERYASPAEALAIGRDGAALDRCRHARSRAPVPADHRLPRSRRDLAKLAVAIEHDLVRTVIPSPTKEVASLVTA
jgi:hypothetical protein